MSNIRPWQVTCLHLQRVQCQQYFQLKTLLLKRTTFSIKHSRINHMSILTTKETRVFANLCILRAMIFSWHAWHVWCSATVTEQIFVHCNFPQQFLPGWWPCWQRSLHAAQRPVYNYFERSTFGRQAFSVAGPMEKNLLPHSLRDPARSTDSFRLALKTHLFAAERGD